MAHTSNRVCRTWLFMALLCAVFMVQSVAPARATPEEGQSREVTLSYLRRTLKALEDTMSFFQKHFDEVNLDAVIGTRIVEGTFKVLLANLERKQLLTLLPADVSTSIRVIYQEAKRVSDDAMPHVYELETSYYERIGPAIREGLWELNYTRRRFPSSVTMWSYRPEETMSEAESDDCLTELLGTSWMTDEMCVISDKCWQQMTSLGYSRYSLSHEIFYLQIGELNGCLPEILWLVQEHGQHSLRRLQDTFCANMLREAVFIAESGYPGPQQDLFMEQAGLCGMYGYWEFFRYQWLETMLGWQDPDLGCYRWDGWPKEIMGASRHRITKREEQRLDNGCLCHRTTVAAGALSQYVRYLVEDHVAEASSNTTETN